MYLDHVAFQLVLVGNAPRYEVCTKKFAGIEVNPVKLAPDVAGELGEGLKSGAVGLNGSVRSTVAFEKSTSPKIC